jgi:phosphoglycerate dehydrogenase-like enzyme
MTRIAVIDDWQGVARTSADWSKLTSRAEVTFFDEPFSGPEHVASALRPFDVLVLMRERTHFPATLIDALPNLRMVGVTGARIWTLDTAACTARGIVISATGAAHSTAATAELTLGLMLAAVRRIAAADASIRGGGFQGGVAPGFVLEGRTLGIIGLGKIGIRMARYGQALSMNLLAWSPNLTAERAQAAGARFVDKNALLEQSDVVSLHVVLSDRSRGLLGAPDLARMKAGAILVNSSRGPLVDEAALIAAVQSGRLIAALDVYAREPLPDGHPLRTSPNTVLTPHLGYCADEVYAQFYGESVENVLAFLDAKPIRLLNPEVLETLGANTKPASP